MNKILVLVALLGIWIIEFENLAMAQTRHGQFMGPERIAQKLGRMWEAHGNPIPLLEPLKNDEHLASLMGAYVRDGGVSVFVNGQPNPINVLVYQLMMESWAKKLSSYCDHPQLPFEPHVEFELALKKTCQEAIAGAGPDVDPNIRAWRDLYFMTMGLGSSNLEWVSWRAATLKFKSRSFRVNAWLSLLLHPDLLMDK